MIKLSLAACCVALLTLGVAVPCTAQTPSDRPVADSANPAEKIPVMDAAVGPCTLELTAVADGKPAYAATVKVHIAYRFGGFHKLDLEASTNVDGKVRFIGLPARVRRPPLVFEASKGTWAGTLTYDPEAECQGKHDILLAPPTGTPAK